MNRARWALTLLAAATNLTWLAPDVDAQVGATRIDRFEATAATARPDADAEVRIDLLRFSTDEEIDALMNALTDGGNLDRTLDDAETVGYVWTAESVGYAIRYAHRESTPNGGERIILALNDPFGTRNPTLWEIPVAGDDPYTVIELRLNGQGQGEGRNTLPTAVAGAFGLDPFPDAQLLLEDVKRNN